MLNTYLYIYIIDFPKRVVLSAVGIEFANSKRSSRLIMEAKFESHFSGIVENFDSIHASAFILSNISLLEHRIAKEGNN